MSHNESTSHVLGMNTNIALEILTVSFGMDFAISTASPQDRRLTCKFCFSISTEVNIPSPIGTLLLMDQRTTLLCTLDNYNSLLLVVMQWHTTIEDPSPLMTMTMISGAITVLYILTTVKEVDGGIKFAL